MTNLIKTDFSRLFKKLSFWICLVIICGLSVFPLVMQKYWATINNEEYTLTAENYLLSTNIVFIPLLIAIVAGIYVVKDFSDHTVRNKIVYGYSRTSIYISNWMVSAFVALFYFFASIAVTLIVGTPLLGINADMLFSGARIYYILISIPHLLTYVSITLFFCMLMQSAGGAIIGYMIHEIMGIISSFTYFMENEKLKKFIEQFFPICQADIIMQGFDEFLVMPSKTDMFILPLYSMIIVVFFTVSGILLFRKSNIK